MKLWKFYMIIKDIRLGFLCSPGITLPGGEVEIKDIIFVKLLSITGFAYI